MLYRSNWLQKSLLTHSPALGDTSYVTVTQYNILICLPLLLYILLSLAFPFQLVMPDWTSMKYKLVQHQLWFLKSSNVDGMWEFNPAVHLLAFLNHTLSLWQQWFGLGCSVFPDRARKLCRWSKFLKFSVAKNILNISTYPIGQYFQIIAGKDSISQKMLKTCQKGVHTKVPEFEKQESTAGCKIRRVCVSTLTYRTWGTKKLYTQGYELDFISRTSLERQTSSSTSPIRNGSSKAY